MIETITIRHALAEVFSEAQARVLAEVIESLYRDLAKAVDFSELKSIVQDLAVVQLRTERQVEELAEAQKHTEQRVDTLAQRMEELVEAQRRTEQRVEELAEAQKRTEQRVDTLAQRVEELAEAQKHTEQRIDALAQRVEELAEAQKRTEQRIDALAQRVEELAEAQKRTEQRIDALAQRVEELAEAQRRTEEALHELTLEHTETRRQLGGLSEAVGYGLEDRAYPVLPRLLERDFGIQVTGRLKRQYVKDKEGQEIEVNIIGPGVRSGREITIVGEGKSQLSKHDVDGFIRRKLERLKGVWEEIFPLMVTYMTSSADVETYVQERGIALYYSYDLL